MPAIVAAKYRSLIAEQKSLLVRLSEGALVDSIERSFVDLGRQVESRLLRMAADLKGQMGRALQQTLETAVRQSGIDVARELAGLIEKKAITVERESERSFLTALLHFDQLAAIGRGKRQRLSNVVMERLRSARERELRRQIQVGVSRLMARLSRDISARIVRLREGDSIADQLLIAEMFKKETPSVRMVSRTNIAWLFNATRVDVIRALQDQGQSVWSRWTELVDDATGAPLDDRVGDDSLALHGQVAEPGGTFTMPEDPRVDHQMWGQSWSHPPNRPNDRSHLLPWRPEYGIPGWRLVDGKRQAVVQESP